MLPPAGVADFDAFARALAGLREATGSPSYAEIARRIGESSGRAPGKVTVYDCFRPGRRRIDGELVHGIVLALTGSAAAAARWRQLAGSLNGARLASRVVVAPVPPAKVDAPARALAPVTLISGLPGVGKTELARALAHGAPSAVEVRLGVTPPADPGAVVRALSGHVPARRPVIVLDDARDPHVVAAVAAAHPAARIIVTSRFALPELGDTVDRIVLGPLDERGSAAAIRSAVGEGADADAVARLVRASGGLPGRLAAIADLVAGHPDLPIGDLVDRVEAAPALEWLRPRLRSVIESLDPAAARLLGTIALIGTAVRGSALERLAGTDGIRRLEDAHLVTVADGIVSVPESVVDVARRAATDSAARRRTAAGLLEIVQSDVAAASVVDEQLARECIAAAELADREGLHAGLVELARAVATPLGDSVRWPEAVAVLELAERVAPLEHRAELAEHLARGYERLGRFDEALGSLHRARRFGEETVPGRTWNIIGNIHRMVGSFVEADKAYREAERIASDADNRVTEGRAVGNRADIARLTGRYAEAEQLFAAAEAISAAVGDDVNLAIVHSNRVVLWTVRGRFDEAIAEARRLIAGAGQGSSGAYLHVLLAGAQLAAGDPAAADATLDRLERERVAGAELFEVDGEFAALRARTALARGALDDAQRWAERALGGAQDAGWPLLRIDALNTLAEVADARADGTALRRHAGQALELAGRLGDRFEQARSLRVLARAELRDGDHAVAARHRAEAAGILEAIGHVEAAAARAEASSG